jgi:hypothetical protein
MRRFGYNPKWSKLKVLKTLRLDDGGFKISGPKLSPFFECTLLTTLPIPA